MKSVASLARPRSLVFGHHIATVTFAAILDIGDGDVRTFFRTGNIVARGTFVGIVATMRETRLWQPVPGDRDGRNLPAKGRVSCYVTALDFVTLEADPGFK